MLGRKNWIENWSMKAKITVYFYLQDAVLIVSLLSISDHQIDPTDFITEQGLNQMLRNVIANFDQTGLRFPIQKFILGQCDPSCGVCRN